MKIISVVSGKGGVGKTTVSANLCTALRKNGQSVIAVDFDPQNALRLHFGINPADSSGIISNGLQPSKWKDAIVKTNEGCSVLPFGKINEVERAAFEQLITTQPHLLKEQLQNLELPKETIVVIDSAGQSTYLKQTLNAANFTIVVNIADAASYTTLPAINDVIEQYCEGRFDYIGSLHILNQINRSRQLSGDIADILATQVGAENIALIHQDQSVQEALAWRTNVIAYAPDSRAAHDFIEASTLISKLIVGVSYPMSKMTSF